MCQSKLLAIDLWNVVLSLWSCCLGEEYDHFTIGSNIVYCEFAFKIWVRTDLRLLINMLNTVFTLVISENIHWTVKFKVASLKYLLLSSLSLEGN